MFPGMQVLGWEHTPPVVSFINGILFSAEGLMREEGGEELLALMGAWVPQLWGLLLMWLPAWSEALTKVREESSR